MKRLCAMLLICLLSSLLSVQAAPGPHPHWSVGFHEMSFLDPLDRQPMRAIAFYPSTGIEHGSQLEGYQIAALAGCQDRHRPLPDADAVPR